MSLKGIKSSFSFSCYACKYAFLNLQFKQEKCGWVRELNGRAAGQIYWFSETVWWNVQFIIFNAQFPFVDYKPKMLISLQINCVLISTSLRVLKRWFVTETWCLNNFLGNKFSVFLQKRSALRRTMMEHSEVKFSFFFFTLIFLGLDLVLKMTRCRWVTGGFRFICLNPQTVDDGGRLSWRSFSGSLLITVCYEAL